MYSSSSTDTGELPYEPLLVGTPRSSDSARSHQTLAQRIPWMSIVVVIILLGLLGLCTWLQVHEASSESSMEINHSAFDNTGLDHYHAYQIICGSTKIMVHYMLSSRSKLLNLVCSIPVSIFLVLFIFSVILRHFSNAPLTAFRALDNSRPPLDFILATPSPIVDKERINAGVVNALFILAVIVFIPYTVYSGLFLNTDLIQNTIEPFPNNYNFATKTDFIVKIFPIDDNYKPFCSCFPGEPIPYCFDGLADSLSVASNRHKKCIVDDMNMTVLTWTEEQTTHSITVDWGKQLPAEIMPFYQAPINESTTYPPVILVGLATGTKFGLNIGMNNYLLSADGSFTNVFESKDLPLLSTFTQQNLCLGGEFSASPGMCYWAEVYQEYTTSCKLPLYQEVLGGYSFQPDHFAVSFEGADFYDDTANVDLAAVAIRRNNPWIPYEATCIQPKRSKVKILVNILTFIGSMVGLQAVCRRLIIWIEKISRRVIRGCV